MDSSFSRALKAVLMMMIQQLNSWSWPLRMSTPAPIPWPGNSGAGLNNRRNSTIPSGQLLNLVFSSPTNNDNQIELNQPQPSKPTGKKVSKSITQLLASTTGVAAGIARVSHRSLHDVWKSQKKSQSTLQAKLAMLTFWTDKSKSKQGRPPRESEKGAVRCGRRAMRETTQFQTFPTSKLKLLGTYNTKPEKMLLFWP